MSLRFPSRSTQACVLGVLLLLATVSGCRSALSTGQTSTERLEGERLAADPFTREVKPVLKANCYSCHAGMNQKGGLRLDTEAGILRGSKHGPIVIPGYPEQSSIVKSIRRVGDPEQHMPPRKELSDREVKIIVSWIQNGAKFR